MPLTYELDPELALLGDEPDPDGFDLTEVNQDLKSAPIFTGDAFEAVGPTALPQRALYGRVLGSSANVQVNSPKLYINTNAPFSGVVCGVQGSGKSHTTSVILESCLMCDIRLGTLPAPLSALLFHFDSAAGSGTVPPCEAAYLASLDEARGGNATPPKITVLVLPNDLRKMRTVYSRLSNVNVEPLRFSPDEISAERLLAMMKVDQEQSMPLYMESVMNILRSMDPFSYVEFRRQLVEQMRAFSPTQKDMLRIRLTILDSCLQGGNASNSVSNHFKGGQLTIIDLSSPFMDGSSACGFFEIILGLFIEARAGASGKLVVLDEAHKYLTTGGSASRLTDSLLTVIRQQRHLGTRVLVSTQEPTVIPPQFLDLCSFVIAHRFSSPKWFGHLKEHISSIDTDWCSKVITLRTGEAMIFSSAGLVLTRQAYSANDLLDIEPPAVKKVTTLGRGYLHVRSRMRITADGGRSLLAAEPTSSGYYPEGNILKGDSESMPDYCSSLAAVFHKSSEVASREVSSTIINPAVEPTSPQSGTDSSSKFWTSQFHTEVVQGAPRPSSRRSTPLSIPVTAAITQLYGEAEGASPPDAVSDAASESTRPSKATFLKPPSPVPTPPLSLPVAVSNPEARFWPLNLLLAKEARRGRQRVSFSDVGYMLKNAHPGLYQKLSEYLHEAAQAHFIEMGGGTNNRWVRILPSRLRSVSGQFTSLVAVMRGLLEEGESRPMFSVVAERLYARYPGSFSGKFKDYVTEAEVAGVVVLHGEKLRLIASRTS